MLDIMTKEDGNVHIIFKEDEMQVAWNTPKIIVTGVGHSGTNLLLEIVRATQAYNVVGIQEDRFFCTGIPLLLVPNYAAKLACDSPAFDVQAFAMNMDKFLGLRVMVTVRHPLDAALSGGFRGMPESMGGDSLYDTIPSYTVTEAEELIELWNQDFAPKLYGLINTYGPHRRAIMFKMEDIVTRSDVVAKEAAKWIGIEYREEMAAPWKTNTHRGQKKRYKGKLDPSQVDVYKRWDTIYDGFYADKKEYVFTLAEGLKEVAKSFKYTIEME